MDLDRELAAIAYNIATEARVLCDRTVKPVEYRTAADVRDVTEGLYLAADQLSLAVRQVAAGLRALEEQQAIHVDGGKDPGEDVSSALRAALNAELGFGLARAALREAAEPLTRLNGTLTPSPGATAAP